MIIKNRFYVGCDDGSGHTRLSPSPGQLGMVVVVVSSLALSPTDISKQQFLEYLRTSIL